MELREFVENCSSNLIIGIYKTGSMHPETEVSIPETLGFEDRKSIINKLCDTYPKSYISGFWSLNADTIAANAFELPTS